jgi:hypothetical protein
MPLRTFPSTNYKFREQLEAVITRPRVAGITHAPSPPEHAARVEARRPASGHTTFLPIRYAAAGSAGLSGTIHRPEYALRVHVALAGSIRSCYQ